jgi:RNA polymerase sigma-70 factor (ECF subfamily)
MKEKKREEQQAAMIDACKRGDSKAQFEVYSKYYRAMYNVALRMLGDTAEAEDIMQESFLKAFQKIGSYRGEVTFGAWLKKIVINGCLDILKTRKAMISLESSPEIPDEEPKEDYLQYRELNLQDVKGAIMDLPDGYRIVLSLYLIEGYDHDEIAQILQITNATSRTQYHRARKQLANRLNNLKAVS